MTRPPSAHEPSRPDEALWGRLPADLVLVKLGGSLITDKTQPRTPRPEALQSLARQLAAALDQSRGELGVILGHGSGSFGHVAAKRHGIADGIQSPDQIAGLVETQRQARALHELVLDALRSAGVPAFSIAPSSAMFAAGGIHDFLATEAVERALSLGLVPVVYGDVLLDRERGAGIASTEAVFLALVAGLARRKVPVRRALWMGETDGVYDPQGRRIDRIDATSWPTLAPQLVGASGTDVTGGMHLRVSSCLELAHQGVSSWILDGRTQDQLRMALREKAIGGTLVAAPE